MPGGQRVPHGPDESQRVPVLRYSPVMMTTTTTTTLLLLLLLLLVGVVGATTVVGVAAVDVVDVLMAAAAAVRPVVASLIGTTFVDGICCTDARPP